VNFLYEEIIRLLTHCARGAYNAAMSNRVIVTKHRIYALASDQQGVPGEEYFTGVTLLAPLTGSGAKVYDTADGPVIAMRSGRGERAARKPRQSKKPQP
jgi:hypothetical protein